MDGQPAADGMDAVGGRAQHGGRDRVVAGPPRPHELPAEPPGPVG